MAFLVSGGLEKLEGAGKEPTISNQSVKFPSEEER
jgi:hypothetical protein